MCVCVWHVCSQQGRLLLYEWDVCLPSLRDWQIVCLCWLVSLNSFNWKCSHSLLPPKFLRAEQMKEEEKEENMPGGSVALLWSAFNILCGIQGAHWSVFRYGGKRLGHSCCYATRKMMHIQRRHPMLLETSSGADQRQWGGFLTQCWPLVENCSNRLWVPLNVWFKCPPPGLSDSQRVDVLWCVHCHHVKSARLTLATDRQAERRQWSHIIIHISVPWFGWMLFLAYIIQVKN